MAAMADGLPVEISRNTDFRAEGYSENACENFEASEQNECSESFTVCEKSDELIVLQGNKTNHVIREIVFTEEDFLQDVIITIDDIMKPLLDAQLPEDVDIETLFGNIEDIRDFSASFLHSLKEVWEAHATFSQKENNELNHKIGCVFIDHAPYMRDVFKTYCRNYDDAITLLEKYEEVEDFQTTLQECLESVKTKVNTFDLGSFLIKPVQRILKYPLLLQELLKFSSKAPCEVKSDNSCSLTTSIKILQDVANAINEARRRKDLVRKYRKGSQEVNLTGKISRLSLHSVKKKSARISLRLSHATGINQPETVDVVFNDVECRFKDLERAIKLFLQNSNNFIIFYRDSLNMEMLLAEHIADLCASDQSEMILKYNACMHRIAEHLYRQFHDHSQLSVHSPLSSLLTKFKGPQAIIDKRFDKLLDYENCQKNSDPKEIQMAKNIYEALNQQLLDELPRFCDLGYKLLETCMGVFVQLQIEFQQKMLKDIKPVLSMCKKKNHPIFRFSVDILDKRSILDAHRLEYNEVISYLSSCIVVPNSFGTVAAMALQVINPLKPTSASAKIQTTTHRQALLNKYKTEDLYVATSSVLPNDQVCIPCATNELLGVIKKQDPMGNTYKWLCDNGVLQGFVPSNVLRPYNESDCNWLLHSSQVHSPTSFSGNAVFEDDCAVDGLPMGFIRNINQSSMSSHSSSSGDGIQFISNWSNKDTVQHPIYSSSQCRNRVYSQPFVDGKRNNEEPTSIYTSNELLEEEEMLDDSEYGEVTQKRCFRAEFPFHARTTLELSVKEGDILNLIVPHDLEGNTEWWLMADCQGKQGYVPANYMAIAEYL